jgi:phage shock protein PspC (stress-responsive transcriptional regulator)
MKFWRTLPPEKFRYRTFITAYSYENEAPCGTVCCLGGWLPAIAPSHWKWYIQPEFGDISLKLRDSERSINVLEGLTEYFGFTEPLARLVFYHDLTCFETTTGQTVRYLMENMPLPENGLDSTLDEVLPTLEWLTDELKNDKSPVWALLDYEP